MKVFEHILVPTDFGGPSAQAIEVAVALVSALDARLTLLHVWDIPTYPYMEVVGDTSKLFAVVEHAAAERLQQALQYAQKRVPTATSTLRMGVPWQEVLATVNEQHPDLVVMGTHGRRGLSHVFLGSVAEKVVRLSEVPVLTVHGPPEP